jgi:hypothetical protein
LVAAGAVQFLSRQEGAHLHTDLARAFLLSHVVVSKGATSNEQTEPVTTGGAKFFNRKWHTELSLQMECAPRELLGHWHSEQNYALFFITCQ